MKSPRVTGNSASSAALNGSTPSASSSCATMIARHRESRPDSSNTRSSVSGAKVFFCSWATRSNCARTLALTIVSVRASVLAQFERVAQEQKKTLAPLTDDLVLLESGLDSLCLAIIVAQLEDALGVDPFSAAEDAEFPVTLGDFIELYEHAAP